MLIPPWKTRIKGLKRFLFLSLMTYGHQGIHTVDVHHNYVTGFGTPHVRTKVEIHFIVYTLKHCPDTVTKLLCVYVDKQVCFTDGFLPTL